MKTFKLLTAAALISASSASFAGFVVFTDNFTYNGSVNGTAMQALSGQSTPSRDASLIIGNNVPTGVMSLLKLNTDASSTNYYGANSSGTYDPLQFMTSISYYVGGASAGGTYAKTLADNPNLAANGIVLLSTLMSTMASTNGSASWSYDRQTLNFQTTSTLSCPAGSCYGWVPGSSTSQSIYIPGATYSAGEEAAAKAATDAARATSATISISGAMTFAEKAILDTSLSTATQKWYAVDGGAVNSLGQPVRGDFGLPTNVQLLVNISMSDGSASRTYALNIDNAFAPNPSTWSSWSMYRSLVTNPSDFGAYGDKMPMSYFGASVAVPLPASVSLIGLGLCGVAFIRRRRS